MISSCSMRKISSHIKIVSVGDEKDLRNVYQSTSLEKLYVYIENPAT